jgi:hypothetical protein
MCNGLDRFGETVPPGGRNSFLFSERGLEVKLRRKTRGIVLMRKLSMIAALAVALVALPGGRAYAGDKPKKTRVPEPTSFVLLSAGLLLCSGAVFVFRRKRLKQN